MKTQLFNAFLLMILAASCTQAPTVELSVSNPLDAERNDATIVISRNILSEQMKLPDGKVPLLLDPDGDPLPCQVDDLDQDGAWDELFAVTDLGPSEVKALTIRLVVPEEYPEFLVRTNVRLGANTPGYPELLNADRLEGVSYHNYAGVTGAAYQMEGPAWETDLVGFRNYLDQRNGMDIFGKLTTEMILDSVGVKGQPSYHKPNEWGMDVLKVGTSLGSGGIGYMAGDSIYRVGDNGTGTYELLVEGSQRSRFKLSFQDWKVGESAFNVDHQIEVIAGGRYFSSTVTYSGKSILSQLVPGIVNIKSDKLHVLTLNTKYTALVTLDTQSEDDTYLAMALLVPTSLLENHGETRDQGEGITQTYYASLTAEPGTQVPYRFYALWELEDPRWASLEEVTGFLEREADRWAYPVEIRFE